MEGIRSTRSNSSGNPPPPGDVTDPRWIALASLCLMALLLVTCLYFLPAGAWWVSVLQSGATAGIVGGLTDWFAVTAIFRGWPGRSRLALPSTNILIRRRRQIEEALLNLLTNRVLGREALREYFANEPPLALLIQGLRKSGTEAERILAHFILNLARNVPVQELTKTLAELVSHQRIPLALVDQVADLLRYLAREDRLDRLFQWLMPRLRSLCFQPAMRSLVASALHETLKAYESRGLVKGLAVWFARSHVMGDLERTSGQLLETFAGELSNAHLGVAGSPGYQASLRVKWWFSAQMLELAGNPRRLKPLVAKLTGPLANPEALSPRLEKFLRQLLDQAADEETGFADRAAHRILDWLDDSPRGGLLDEEIGRALPDWIHQADLRTQFRRTLVGYSNEELAGITRQYVATDLHWIRVSGTLIGFLVGIALAALVSLVDFLAQSPGPF